jgi:transposase
LNLESLLATYVGGGTSAFHPLMMLKTLVYAYLSKVYSSRRISKALREDVNFMWLSGMSRPDHRTINDFRSSRLKEVIEQVFGSMVMFLESHGYIDFKEYFVDGTKLRADSNRHKAVWSKNTKRYKEIVQQKIQELLKHIERTNDEENKRYGDNDLEECGEHTTLTSTDVKEQIQRLKDIVDRTAPNKQTAKTIKTIENKLLPKLEGYEQQEKTLAGRNSYAKTDPDATMFRMKDEQLLPAYNILMGTQNQFIVNYSFHQRRASEADGFKYHIEHFHQMTGRYPTCVMGDSTYGSQETYALLEQHKIGNYLKYNTFHFEQKKKHRNDPYQKENFSYDSSSDTYTCPQGRSLKLKEIKPRITGNGYRTTVRIYQCVDCRDCPVSQTCKKGVGERSIQVNPILDVYRAQARANLTSQRGIALRKQRNVDIESVFGDIKYNQGYNRCRLRGKSKVNIEFALLSIAHNTKKIALQRNNTSLSHTALDLACCNLSSISITSDFQRTFWTTPD